jgi:hypothetical protein
MVHCLPQHYATVQHASTALFETPDGKCTYICVTTVPVLRGPHTRCTYDNDSQVLALLCFCLKPTVTHTAATARLAGCANSCLHA